MFTLLSIHLTGESSIALMVANRSKDNERHQVLILAPLALLDQYGPYVVRIENSVEYSLGGSSRST